MAKTFQGRAVVPGNTSATALVSRKGFNTLASFQKALMFKDKSAKCSDQNNPDIYEKPMHGAALCLPQTIGSTTGGMVLFCAAALGSSPPACSLVSRSTRSPRRVPSSRTFGRTFPCPLWIRWATNSSPPCRPAQR